MRTKKKKQEKTKQRREKRKRKKKEKKRYNFSTRPIRANDYEWKQRIESRK